MKEPAALEVYNKEGKLIFESGPPNHLPRIGEYIHYEHQRYLIYYVCHYVKVNKIILCVSQDD